MTTCPCHLRAPHLDGENAEAFRKIKDCLEQVLRSHQHKTHQCECCNLCKEAQCTNFCLFQPLSGHEHQQDCFCQSYDSLLRNISMRFFHSCLPSSPARYHNLLDLQNGWIRLRFLLLSFYYSF